MSDLLMMGSTAPSGRPWMPCRKVFAGNMCGIYTPDLPPIPGGSPASANLVISWFLNKYSPQDQQRILAGFNARGLTDILVSWDSSQFRDAQAFADWCWGLYQRNLEPAVMLTSKYAYDYSTPNAQIMRDIGPVLLALKRRVGRICVGFELNLFRSPEQLHELIDLIAPYVVPWGGRLYVHFSPGYFAWQEDGNPTSKFWNDHYGQLTGIFHQRDLSWDMPMYQARIVDCLERFAGRDGFTPDNGIDGTPRDFIALEITALDVYRQGLSEAYQEQWADDAMSTPPVQGPLGLVRVMGSGNGLGSIRPAASYPIGMHPMLSGPTLPAHPNM